MSAFAIALAPGSAGLGALIKEKYPDSYECHDLLYLISCEGSVKDIAYELGIMQPGRNEQVDLAAVYKLTKSYAGCEKSALWDWLDHHTH